MLNTREYKIFLENNCLICKRYKGTDDDNCGTNKRIEISQYPGAEALFPSKDLIKVPNISNYSCKKIEYKTNYKQLAQVNIDLVKKDNKANAKNEQIGMF